MRKEIIEKRKYRRLQFLFLCLDKEENEKKENKIFIFFTCLVVKKGENKENFIQLNYIYTPTIITYII